MWFSLSLSKPPLFIPSSFQRIRALFLIQYDVIFTFTLLTEIDWFKSSNWIILSPALKTAKTAKFSMWIWSFRFERYQSGNYAVQCELTVDINIIDIPDKQAAAKAQCNSQTKSCLRFSKINIIWSYCEQNSRSPIFFDKRNLFYVQSAAITKRTYFEK